MKIGKVIDGIKGNKKRNLVYAKLKELGYEKPVLEQTMADIRRADDEVRSAILKYVHTGTITNVSQEPLNVEMMMEAYQMNPIAAMLFMDWYRREPESAMQCILLGVDDIEDITMDEAEMEEIDVEVPKEIRERLEGSEEISEEMLEYDDEYPEELQKDPLAEKQEMDHDII